MVLETERLILRNFKPTDIEDYWEMVQMPNVGPRAGWPAYTEYDKAVERLEKVQCVTPNLFAIVYKPDNKMVGSIELMDCKVDRYSNLDIEAGAKEIGFVLNEKYWGKGIMTEATKAVLEYAFEVLNVENIYIGNARANIASGRVQEKLGFKVVGEVKNYRIWVDGTPTDFIERKMTRVEWLKNK